MAENPVAQVMLPALTIYEVQELEAAFNQSGGANQNRVFDLSQLEEVDACGIQWLLTVKVRLSVHGFHLELKNSSQAIVEKINNLGLGTLLESQEKEVLHG